MSDHLPTLGPTHSMRDRRRVGSHDSLSVVIKRRIVICVKRQKKNCSSLACSNHDTRSFPMRVTVPQQRQPYVGVREIQRVHNFFVREFYLRAVGDDEPESHALTARASALEDYALGSRAVRGSSALRRSLLFQFPIKGSRNIHGSTHRIWFRRKIIPCVS